MARKKIIPVGDIEASLASYLGECLVPDLVTRHLFRVTDMTLYRWERKPELGFPQAIKIEGRKYRKAAEIRAFRMRFTASQ
jgi:hypothetical protein